MIRLGAFRVAAVVATVLSSFACSTSHFSAGGDAGAGSDGAASVIAGRTAAATDPPFDAGLQSPDGSPPGPSDSACHIELPPGGFRSETCGSTPPLPTRECGALGGACFYESMFGASLDAVLIATCESGGWSVDFGLCRRSCTPRPESGVVELDASDCAEREITPCAAGLTALQRLEATLDDAMSASGFERFEINEAYLQFELESGCPRRFYHSWGNPLMTADELGDTLSALRLSCALELSSGLVCAEVAGPSTIAAE